MCRGFLFNKFYKMRKKFNTKIIDPNEEFIFKSRSTTNLEKRLDRNFTIILGRNKTPTDIDEEIVFIYESDMFSGPYYYFYGPKKTIEFYINVANGCEDSINELQSYFGQLWDNSVFYILCEFYHMGFFVTEKEAKL